MNKNLLLLLLLPGCAAPGVAQTLKNGGFESPYQPVSKPTSPLAQIDGIVADGWRDESGWGEVSIGYGQDTDQKRGGASAQRIDVRSITAGKGGVQFVQELPFVTGRTYRFSAQVRSATPTSATLMLRKSGTPYTTYGLTELQITPEWQSVDVTAQATENTQGLVMFLPKTVGTYWIDDAKLEDVTNGGAPTAAPAPAAATGQIVQVLKNGGLETPYQAVTAPTSPKAKIDGEVAGNWRDESGWGEVSIGYSRDGTNPRGGSSAQRIEVRSIGAGGVQFVQEMPFKANRIYRATAWLRSNRDTVVALSLRQSGAPYSTYGQVQARLTPEWQRFEITAPSTATDNGLLLLSPSEPGTYWIDDASCEDVTDAGAAPQAAAPATAQNIANTGPAQAVQTLNGGMESPYLPVTKATSPLANIEGQLAQGWRDDSGWGEVSIAYSRDEVQAHGGGASQRIDLRSVGKGGIQFVQGQPLTAGRIYRVSAYIRSAVNSHAVLQIRQRGAPYQIYGQLNATPSPEWHYVEVFAKVTDTTDGLILFSPTDLGTYWIDDVKFEDVTDTLATVNTAKTGNLWTAGSFETGLSDGWHMRVAGFDINSRWTPSEHLDIQPRSDATTAADGEKSVAVSIGAWTGALLGSPLTPVTFGQTYTASIALKADQPTTVGLSLDGTTSSKEVQVGPTWQRYALSGTAVLGTTSRFRVRCIVRESEKPVTFWLDSAMFEAGSTASPAYLAPFPVELGMSVPRPGAIVFDGEAAPVEVRVASGHDAALPTGARLKWSVENLAGQVTQQPTLPLPTKALSLAPDAKSPRGIFKIHAQVIDAVGKPLSGTVEKVFSRLPKPRPLTAQQKDNSYFGVHIDLQPEKIAIANAVGARWIRLHDVTTATLWPTVEAQPGQWTYNDAGIKLARASGLNVLGLLGGAPAYATKNPQAQYGFFSSWNVPDAPGATEMWSQYVKQTVAHYKPLISNWEIWNEPYINGAQSAFFPNGTPEQYGELLRRASVAVRETDPKATIVGVCSPGNANEWLDRVLKTAGPSNFDVMSFHGYYSRLQGSPTPQVAPLVADLAAAQSRFGTARPMWNTEGSPSDNLSWYVEPTSAMRRQMSSSVRLDITQIANGVRKFFPYTLHGDADQGEGNLYMLEYDRALKPSIGARAVLANFIDGAAFVSRTEPMAGVDSYTFKQTDGQTVHVVWSYDFKPHTLAVAAGQKALDVFGNPISSASLQIGEEPVYLVKN